MKESVINSDEGILDFFPEPYPDELFSNLVYRYHIFSGNSTAVRTTSDLFNRSLGRIRNSLLPSYLDIMSKRLLCEMFQSEYFIFNHSVFRLMRLFLSEDKLKKCVNDMKFGSSVSTYYQTGLVGNSKWLKTRPYVCDKCLEEDIALYGEGYIRSLHQVPGYLYCHRHSVPLRKIDHDDGNYIYIDIDMIDYEAGLVNISDSIKNEVEKISTILSNLYDLRIDELTFEKLLEKYDLALGKKGYKKGKYIKSEELAKDFQSYYSYDFLKYYDSHDHKKLKVLVE